MSIRVWRAEVPAALYDEHRRVMVLPAVLTAREAARTVAELLDERRGPCTYDVPRQAPGGPSTETAQVIAIPSPETLVARRRLRLPRPNGTFVVVGTSALVLAASCSDAMSQVGALLAS